MPKRKAKDWRSLPRGPRKPPAEKLLPAFGVRLTAAEIAATRAAATAAHLTVAEYVRQLIKRDLARSPTGD